MQRNIALIILSLISFFVTAEHLKAEQVSVKTAEGVEKIDYLEKNNVSYFSMSQLAEVLGEKLSWEELALSISFQSDGHKFIFFTNSPYLRLDDTVKNLTYPAEMRKGQLYLPAQTFLPLLDAVKQEHVGWDEGHKTIRIDSKWYNITDLSLSPKANGLLIEIYLTEPKEYEVFTSEGNWLNITIVDGTVNRRQILARKSDKLLSDMNVFQFDASAQISFRFRKDIGKYTHRYLTNPGRIQISLIDTLAAPIVMPNAGQIGPDKHIDKVIIDAGHGGDDYGAIGLKSTKEKEVVLDIANRLARLIKQEKMFEAVLTRVKDEYVSLSERASIANKSKGDIFVSIHANASPRHAIRGFQVFFLAPAKNDSARAVAQFENAPFLAEKSSGLDKQDNLGFIISDMIQTEFQSESADLAAMVDKEFRKSLSETAARGIDQAGFFLLNGVYMPSILVETAFITNREDEKLLNDRKYRQEVAESIYNGLKRFKNKYESK